MEGGGEEEDNPPSKARGQSRAKGLAKGRATAGPYPSLDSPFHSGFPAVSPLGGLLCRRRWGSAARPGGGSTLTFRSFPLLLAGAFATSHFFLRCRRPHLAERCPHRWHQGQRPKSAQHAAHSLTTAEVEEEEEVYRR